MTIVSWSFGIRNMDSQDKDNCHFCNSFYILMDGFLSQKKVKTKRVKTPTISSLKET